MPVPLFGKTGSRLLTQSKRFRCCGDVRQRIKPLEGQQFDRIYFDPPYASDLYQPVIEAIARYQLLAAEGELAVEHSGDRSDLPIPLSLEVCRQKMYGNTGLTFFCTRRETG